MFDSGNTCLIQKGEFVVGSPAWSRKPCLNKRGVFGSGRQVLFN